MCVRIPLLRLSVAAAVLLTVTVAQAAERPPAPQILPESTLVYLRVASTPEMVEKFQETSIGRIFMDPQVRPLIADLYSSASEAFKQVEERVGASLDELLQIPQGELCVGLVAPEQGDLAVVALIDAGERMPWAEKVMDQGVMAMIERGATPKTEKVGSSEIEVFRFGAETEREVAICKRDGTILVTTNVEVCKQVLKAWDGEPIPTLSDSKEFVTCMMRCAGIEGERPHITAYVDPIRLANRAFRDNLGAQVALAMLPALGLDGLEAIGASVAFSPEEFDSVIHLHVLLDNPRRGVFEITALASGDCTPESWVPADVASYTTLHWDVDRSYAALETLYNSIRGEDALARDMKARLSDPLKVDFKQDFLDQLDGRLTYVTWMVKPARLNSQANLVAFKMKDADAVGETLKDLASRFGSQMTEETFSGVTYYRTARGLRPSTRREDGQERPPSEVLRAPEPCLGVLGDYLMLCDSEQFLKYVISAKGDASNKLAESLDFRLVSSRIRRQSGGEKPGLISFNRPEEGMRNLYEMGTAEGVRGQLASQAENNGFFGALNGALDRNPLPPFSVIAQYLAPGGGLLTSDETGFHYMGFTLKRK